MLRRVAIGTEVSNIPSQTNVQTPLETTNLRGSGNLPKDQNTDQLNSLYTPDGNFLSIRNTIVRNLHRVGLLGIKSTPTSQINWITDARSSLSPGELRPSSIIHVHPMFYRTLGIRA